MIGFLIFLSLLFMEPITSCYEKQVRELWTQASQLIQEKSLTDGEEGLFPVDVKSFLTERSQMLSPGEELLIFFYPKRSGFDLLVKDSSNFLEVGEFRKLARSLGFEILHCERKGHMASFSSREELCSFVLKYFHSELKEELSFPIEREDGSLSFPSRIVIATLKKL
ncbi:MAG: hypothetical protein KR126chlam1_01359 [Chlamydiae bacterium]|nr:hypothetical protein [Chlamydiota bacterium]